MRLLNTLLLSAVALAASAQMDDMDWRGNGRPICVDEQPAADAHQHRVVRRLGSQKTAPLSAKGVQKIPVLLVEFADKSFTTVEGGAQQLNEFYGRFCNGTLDGNYYTGHGSYGSVRDYFVTQSDSAFLPEFTVIGPVRLTGDCATYGRNEGETKDVGARDFRSQSVALAQEVYQGDWMDFDNDHNGTVDMIFFIFAGLGENTDGGPDCLWPRETFTPMDINGITYDVTGCTSEARSRKKDGVVVGLKTDGVGVFVHELSHSLGLPDFYDTQYVAFGMDMWSVMDYGNYANNGYTPGNYTAYERDFMGWRPLITLSEPQVLTIPCFADGGYGYKVVNDANPSEYYVLENRQPRGWDTAVCTYGKGLQVTHVDYNFEYWRNNSVNTIPTHQRMTIIAANNNYEGSNSATSSAAYINCLGGNLFPGNTFNYELTDDSEPASVVYTGGFMHKAIRHITENEDGTVTLCFRTHGQLETPDVSILPTDVDEQGFTAEWGEVEHATAYVVSLEDEQAGVVSTETYTATTATYSGLRSDARLRYRVKAVADSPEDYLDSEWSEYVSLKTLVDEIPGIDDSRKMVAVYNMGGILLTQCHADELRRLEMRPGIYVVKYSNGQAKKIVLR